LQVKSTHNYYTRHGDIIIKQPLDVGQANFNVNDMRAELIFELYASDLAQQRYALNYIHQNCWECLARNAYNYAIINVETDMQRSLL